MKAKKQCILEKEYQDGAIWNGLLFRFHKSGKGLIYDVKNGGKILSELDLGENGIWCPHCNTVVFGREKVSPDDEFPLLYANVYNAYKKEPDRREGTLLAYRITRHKNAFSAELVQVIRIGFIEDLSLWKSLSGNGDVRPYGNFVIDRDKKKLWAFVMRDREKITRFFAFDLPKLADGKTVTLRKEDIKATFDTPYMRYMQGAEMKDGRIYSLEGFTTKPGETNENPPAIRVIDTNLKKEILYRPFSDICLTAEPELITFDGPDCYYGDSGENLYMLEDLFE